MGKTALFLGAGASVPYGKPTTKMFKEILSKTNHFTGVYMDLSSFLKNEHFEDIEHVLQSIKEIRLFLDSYAGKYFTSTYCPLKISNSQNEVSSLDKEQSEQELKIIENTIKDEIYTQYRWDDKYDEPLVHIFNKLFSVIPPIGERIYVFTTNYDNAIERYCDITQKYDPVDGFKLNHRGRNFIWDDFFETFNHVEGLDIFLHKLHGSLDWKQLRNEQIIKTSEESKATDPRYKHNMIIYPTLSPKEEENQEPYKTIIGRFKKFMDDADVCIVIGYSFRDHLNNIFLKFLNRGDKKLLVISPTATLDCMNNLFQSNTTISKTSSMPLGTKLYYNYNGIHSKILCYDILLNIQNIDNIIKEIQTQIKPSRLIPRETLFMDILKVLETGKKKPVDIELFIQELVSSGKFNSVSARIFIKRMLRELSIYESQSGYINRT